MSDFGYARGVIIGKIIPALALHEGCAWERVSNLNNEGWVGLGVEDFPEDLQGTFMEVDRVIRTGSPEEQADNIRRIYEFLMEVQSRTL